MHKIRTAIAGSTLALFLACSGAMVVAAAQDHDNHQYVKHEEWKKGAHIRDEDWKRGEHIEWKEHHLHRPPDGYEWREIDGNYVLANSSSGVISMTVVAPR